MAYESQIEALNAADAIVKRITERHPIPTEVKMGAPPFHHPHTAVAADTAVDLTLRVADWIVNV